MRNGLFQFPAPAIRILIAASLLAMTACGSRDSAESPARLADSATPPYLGAEAWPAIANPVADPPEVAERIASLLARMSPEEKVGQIIQAEIRYTTPEDVRDYHLGSVLNGGGTRPGDKRHATPGDWLALADAYYDASMDTADGGVAIPIIWGTDAVHGHSNVFGATIFPHNIGLGAMRNPDLVREIGRVTAREVRVTGLDWTFSPTVAVAQDDRWGRTYESYGEDPALVRDYAAQLVLGLQGEPGTPEFLGPERVIATAKHYLGDGGTRQGDDRGDTRVTEAELRDIHAPGYAGALQAGVQTVMASFSSWNGERMHGHQYLLTDILKGRLGLDGFVVGDWNGHGQVRGCSNTSCAATVNAGLDMFMAIRRWKSLYRKTLRQVKSGEIPLARLDDAVSRVLRVKIRAGLFERGRPSSRRLAGAGDVLGSAEHRAVARRAVRESLVLLKNRGGLLPIRPGQRVLVAGDGADDIGQQVGGWSITWQGTGASNDDYPGGTSILAGLAEAVAAVGGSVEFAEHGSFLSRPDLAVVVFGEEPYAEFQGDLDTLEFEPRRKESLALLQKLRAAGIPVVSVFLAGRPLWVNPELNASDAFVAAWLPGTEGGGVADVLVAGGDGQPRHDFSGRLSFSWPQTPDQGRLNPHHEGYHPLFEYGYGLSYAAGEEGPGVLSEDVAGVLEVEQDSISLYHGRPLAPWEVYLDGDDADPDLFYGQSAVHDSGAVSLRTVDMKLQEDALEASFSGSVTGKVFIVGSSLDLGAYQAEGVLTFMARLERPLTAELRLRVGDGVISLASRMQGLVGQGWQPVTVPLSCFADTAEALERVSVPFALVSEGAMDIAFGEIRFDQRGASDLGCGDG
jgi:beta-glucosidase